MIIRTATARDIPRIAEMAARFIAETKYATVLEAHPDRLEALAAKVLEIGAIFVAGEELTIYPCGCSRLKVAAGMCDHGIREEMGHLVAFIALAVVEDIIDGRPRAEEIAWWVEPEHRPLRAGHKLLGAAEDWARQKGVISLKMVAPSGSTVGAFLERRGYVHIESAYMLGL